MNNTIIELNETIEVNIILDNNNMYQIAVLVDGAINHNETFSNLALDGAINLLFILKDKYQNTK